MSMFGITHLQAVLRQQNVSSFDHMHIRDTRIHGFLLPFSSSPSLSFTAIIRPGLTLLSRNLISL